MSTYKLLDSQLAKNSTLKLEGENKQDPNDSGKNLSVYETLVQKSEQIKKE